MLLSKYFLDELTKLDLTPQEFVYCVKDFSRKQVNSEFQLKLEADKIIREAKLKSEDSNPF